MGVDAVRGGVIGSEDDGLLPTDKPENISAVDVTEPSPKSKEGDDGDAGDADATRDTPLPPIDDEAACAAYAAAADCGIVMGAGDTLDCLGDGDALTLTPALRAANRANRRASGPSATGPEAADAAAAVAPANAATVA